jgi:hypothetical protein
MKIHHFNISYYLDSPLFPTTTGVSLKYSCVNIISNRYDLDSIKGKIMTIEQAVLEKLRELPPDKQQEVLDFIQSLKQKSLPKKPRRRL